MSEAEPSAGRRPWAWLAVAAYPALVFGTMLPFWLAPWRVEDDASTHLLPFILHRYDAALGDTLLADYARDYLPAGYRWLFSAVARVADPNAASQVLGMLMLAACWLLAALVGRRLAGRFGAAAMLILAAHSQVALEHSVGGMYRGFALPLLLGWLWAALAERWRLAWALVPFMALVYPQAAMAAGLAGGLDLAARLLERRGLPASDRGLWAWAALMGGLAAAALVGIQRRPAYFGSLYSAAQAACMPEWHAPHGRLHFFPQPSAMAEVQAALAGGMQAAGHAPALLPLASSARARGLAALTLAFGALSLALLVRGWRRGRRELRAPLLLALAALLLYAAARATLFRLGWPDRFLVYALAPWTWLALPLAWRQLSESDQAGRRWRPALIALLALPFLAQPALPATVAGVSHDVRRFLPLYAFIRDALPPRAVIAGWPDEALDFLPAYAHRAVLANQEMAQPMYRGYYEVVRERLEDSVRAHYVEDASDPILRRLSEQWGATHFLVEKRVYGPVRPPLIIEPFRKLARTLYDADDKERHLLFRPPVGSVVYEDDLVYLVDLSKVR